MSGNHKIHYPYPPIGSLKALAKTLDISEAFLKKIADEPSNFYNVFIKEVKGKSRTLSDPNPELKIIQKKINSRIFEKTVFPHYLHGGIKTKNPRDFLSNATAHSHAEVAVAFDIKNFFPSITLIQVERVFLYLFKFPKDVSELLAKITTLGGCVPQGAPTSSYISNLIMWEKEYKLAAKLESKGFVYTRLIDDITVSSKSRVPKESLNRISTEVINMLTSYGFSQNAKKFQICSRGDPKNLMTVTGLWLNRGAPRLDKNKRDEICHMTVELEKKAGSPGMRYEQIYHDEFSSISGKIALLNRLRHPESIRLKSIIGRVPPIFDEARKLKTKKIVLMFCRKGMERSKFGYVKRFYQLQHEISIIKRTDRSLAKFLQSHLNKRRPTKTIREFYE